MRVRSIPADENGIVSGGWNRAHGLDITRLASPAFRPQVNPTRIPARATEMGLKQDACEAKEYALREIRSTLLSLAMDSMPPKQLSRGPHHRCRHGRHLSFVAERLRVPSGMDAAAPWTWHAPPRAPEAVPLQDEPLVRSGTPSRSVGNGRRSSLEMARRPPGTGSGAATR